jgi:hypothetical protein
LTEQSSRISKVVTIEHGRGRDRTHQKWTELALGGR